MRGSHRDDVSGETGGPGRARATPGTGMTDPPGAGPKDRVVRDGAGSVPSQRETMVDRRVALRWLGLAAGAGLLARAGSGSPLLASLASAPLRSRAGFLHPWDAGGSRLLRAECRATGADVEGPFYLTDAPRRALLAGPDEPGDRILIRGTVLGPDCRTPLRGALLDVWQADAEGRYHDEKQGYRLRGRILTDERGAYEFESVMPGRYRLAGGYRPAHIHFIVSGPAHHPLTTQLYFKGDPYLAPKDACGADCRSDDAGRIIELARERAGRARFSGSFDIVLKALRA